MIRNELIKPFTIKLLSLPGRVVMAPRTRSRSPHNIPGPDMAQYYRRRAEKTIQYLLERLERNEFDLIAIGRGLLADPEWVTKMMDDRFEEINTFTMESLNTLY